MRRAVCLLPLLWLVPAAATALGSAAAMLFGYSIEWMEPAPDGLRAFPVTPDGTMMRNLPLAFRLIPLLSAAAGAALFRRSWPAFTAALLLAAGRTAFSALSLEAWFQPRPWTAFAIAAAILAMAVGVHWSVSAERFRGRLGQALIVFALPVALAHAWQLAGSGPRRPPAMGAGFWAAGVVPAMILGSFRSGAGALPGTFWTLTAALSSLAIPALVATGARYSKDAQAARLKDELARVRLHPAPQTYPRHFFQRGVSFVGDGFRAYHPERSARMMDLLKRHGVDAVALIPYGRSEARGTGVRFEAAAQTRDLYNALGHLARARGIRILLKPQLLVFGPGMFPGVIDPPDAAARRAWFASYREFILHWAGIAAGMHADLFCVGTELARLSRHETEWRDLIREVRRIYAGPLVYAATQGEEFEQLRFWDALDYIGLNNYYPLPPSLDVSAVAKKVEAVQAKAGKPLIFTEVGFASVEGSHREPWAEPLAPVSLQHQERCYQALFEAFYRKPWFYGMYWWKISADGRGGPEDRSLTPWRKPAMEVVRRWYAALPPGRTPSSPDSGDGTPHFQSPALR